MFFLKEMKKNPMYSRVPIFFISFWVKRCGELDFHFKNLIILTHISNWRSNKIMNSWPWNFFFLEKNRLSHLLWKYEILHWIKANIHKIKQFDSVFAFHGFHQFLILTVFIFHQKPTPWAVSCAMDFFYQIAGLWFTGLLAFLIRRYGSI